MSLSLCILCGLRTIFRLEYCECSQPAMLLTTPPPKSPQNRGMIFDPMELRTLLEKTYSEQINKQINIKLQL